MVSLKLKDTSNQKAVIWGASGQDGSYLSELLLSKGYKVFGVVRRASTDNTERIRHIDSEDFNIVEGDITDAACVSGIIGKYKPDECYNLAAMSHVGTSFTHASSTFEINAIGVINILEGIKNLSPHTRFYQASTSEQFGSEFTEVSSEGVMARYQDENTRMAPNSPYAVAKLAAHYMVKTYRESYGLHASSGILMNHESPRRGEDFVTRKITKWLGEFKVWKDDLVWEEDLYEDTTLRCSFDTIYQRKHDNQLAAISTFPKLRLGNIEAFRDWGYAPDFVEAMWLMLQQDKPDDYVICTGKTRSIKDFLRLAFDHIGIENWEDYIVIDPEFYRPNEVEYLRGSCSKATRELVWYPKTQFSEMVTKMMDSDYEKAREKVLQKTLQKASQ